MYCYALTVDSREETTMKKWAVLAGAGLCAAALTTAVMTADETITGRLVVRHTIILG